MLCDLTEAGTVDASVRIAVAHECMEVLHRRDSCIEEAWSNSVCSTRQVHTIITDDGVGPELVEALHQQQVRVVVV